MTDKPRKWIALLLSLPFAPLGLMYVGRAGLAGLYFGLTFAVVVAVLLSPSSSAVTGGLSLLLTIVAAVHAYWLAGRYPEHRPRPWYSRWYGLLGATASVALLVLAARSFCFEPFRAPSGSMLPTIPPKTTLVVQKWGYGNYGTFGFHLARTPMTAAIARGDMVVFEFPQDRAVSFVKRVVALPGDKITFRGTQVVINGSAVPQAAQGPYYDAESLRYLPRFVESLPGHEYSVLAERNAAALLARRGEFPFSQNCTGAAEDVTCEVPAGHFFVLGDNRDNSNDSRMWGFVPADHIIGKVVFVGS